jgi:hypothetical protein
MSCRFTTSHDLQLLEPLGAKEQRPKLQKASEHDVAERPEQDRLLQDDRTGGDSTSRAQARRPASVLMHPHTLGLPRKGQRGEKRRESFARHNMVGSQSQPGSLFSPVWVPGVTGNGEDPDLAPVILGPTDSGARARRPTHPCRTRLAVSAPASPVGFANSVPGHGGSAFGRRVGWLCPERDARSVRPVPTRRRLRERDATPS